MASRIPARTRRAWLMRAVIASTFALPNAASAQEPGDPLGLRGTCVNADDSDAPDTTGAIPPSAATSPPAAASAAASASAADSIPAGGAPSPEPGDGETQPPPRTTPLPALEPYPGAQRLDQRGGPKGPAGGQTPSPTVAAAPTGPRKRPPKDERPFDPIGVRIGTVRVLPYVEESLGWSSNPLLLAGSQRASAFLRSEAGLGIDTDWPRSALHADLKGGWTDYFSNSSADAPYFNGLVDTRWEATRDIHLDAEARAALTTMTASSLGLSPNVAFGPTGAPLTATYGATLGGDARFGRFDFALHGLFDRTTYEDVTYSDGATQKLSANDFDDYGLRGRFSYEMSPALKPFIDLLFDARRYGDGVDQYGYARNSDGVMARAGVEIDLAKTLTGAVSLGYGMRAYDDPRLPNLSSPLVDASLAWTPTALTTVTLRTVSSLAETTILGASGAVQHATTLEVAHALRRYFTVTPSVSYVTDSYAGLSRHDATTTFGLAASYNLNRNAVLKASLSREFYTSNLAGTNACATVISVGLRLQR